MNPAYNDIFRLSCEVGRTNTALVIVDMQYNNAHPNYGFCLAAEKIKPGSMNYFNQRIETITIPALKSLIDFFRSADMQIVYLMLGSEFPDYQDWQPRYRNWAFELEKLSGIEKIFWKGSPLYRIRDEIRPKPEDIIVEKRTYGAFSSSDIEKKLRNKGLENLLLTGVSTGCCVESTGREAVDRGFGCIIVDEGTCDYDDTLQRASLRDFEFNMGEVYKTVDDVRKAFSVLA
jgi:biuret amidohydrolase